MTVIAHVAGAASVLYLAPIVIVVGLLFVQNVRDRRADARESNADQPEAGGPSITHRESEP